MTAVVLILALVTAQRLAELWLSAHNTRALLARGAVEHGRAHYPLIVTVHAAWLLSLWWLAPGRPIVMLWLALFVLLQIGRLWVIGTLGQRWTTRIIVQPGARLVRRGPYRFVRHPNYLVVAGEIAALPMAFGLPTIALIFSLLNALVLVVRVRAEDRALDRLRAVGEEPISRPSPRHRQ